ncbi:MAG: protein kinase [Thermoanaerobaculia bacterium]
MKLSRYEVVRELGKGAMGVVYLAKDPLIGRLVALKTIRLAPADDDEEAREFRHRFVREAQAAGILSHPSIVTVHDIGEDESTGTSFIAMEYVEGLNLKQILMQDRTLPPNETLEILAQVADALDYAHLKGIIHRDVKPANIIRFAESRAKITDFGIAKFASGSSNLTTTGQFIGTPNYMSPEQIKGVHVDGRTDIFSLGIVLYEALTRRKPFGGDSLTTISYKIVHEGYVPIREVNPDLPDEIEDVVVRCLSKEPADRYQRGRDVAADLLRIARGDDSRRTVEPLHFEQTLMSRSDRLPTVETPFPDAGRSAAAVAVTVPADTPTPDLHNETLAVATPRPRERQTLKQTLSRIRIPEVGGKDLDAIARTRISPLLFFGVIAIAALLALVPSLLIARNLVSVPPVDTVREQAVQRQRELRLRGARLLQAGDVDGAWATYRELQSLAPGSPAVASTLDSLEKVRIERMTEQQKLAEARQKLTDGQALYEQSKFEAAIPLFEEAFHLDPNLEEAVNYLRMTREQMALRDQTRRKKQLASRTTPASLPESGQSAASAASEGGEQIPAKPSALVTVLDSPVNDGYVMIRVGGDTVVHENLWESSSGFFRRKVPRKLNVYREVPARTQDVEVWVIVPSLNLNFHQKLSHEFASGIVNRLTIQLDAAKKQVMLQFS